MIFPQRRMIYLALVTLTSVAGPVVAAPWVKGFVANRYEYAFRFAGREGFAHGTAMEAGVDCVRGSDAAFFDEQRTRIALSQNWRSPEEIEAIVSLPGVERMKDPVMARLIVSTRAVAYRGYKRGIETYVNPWAAEDPGIWEVVSRIGEGMNLDGKVDPNDFVSPDGEMGIDNNLYRAWGCLYPYRRHVDDGGLRVRGNTAMRDGRIGSTMVVRLSGNQDPVNDSDVTVEVGYSPDNIGKDAQGQAAGDFTYRILKSEQYTKLKGKLIDGVLETEQVPRLHAPGPAWLYSHTGDIDLHEGRIRLKLDSNGQLAAGLIAGYRTWYDLYAHQTFAQDGGQENVREHEDSLALYYAVRRNADGLYNEKTGKFDGISTAYRIQLVSAFLIDSDQPIDREKQGVEELQRQGFQVIRAATIRGAETRTLQPVPPGTGEAALGQFELNPSVTNLPTYQYLLKTLDRPHFPNQDEKGLPPWVYAISKSDYIWKDEKPVLTSAGNDGLGGLEADE